MADSDYVLMGFRRMVESDMQGGEITYDDATYDATIGHFDVKQMLVNGGFTPMVVGVATVARIDLPDGLIFQRGATVVATPNSGPVRGCQILSVIDMGALVEITLNDANQEI